MQQIAGVLFFLGGTVVILGVMTAEIFYPPGYNVSLNMISNLGSTPPPDSIIREPSAGIFDSTMMISGILILSGSYLLYKIKIAKGFLLSIVGMGVGAFGVGFFPAYHVVIHPIVALATFLFGSVAAIQSARIVSWPFRPVVLLFGILSLVCLLVGVLLPDSIVPILGRGGTERWIAYPILLWLIGLGGYFMNTSVGKSKHVK